VRATHTHYLRPPRAAPPGRGAQLKPNASSFATREGVIFGLRSPRLSFFLHVHWQLTQLAVSFHLLLADRHG
jgi:hypothetical protein